jgi:hypothetical protein
MQKPYAMHRFIGPSAPKITHSIPRRPYFLSEVCTSTALKLSIAYSNERELEDELILICGMLGEIDPENVDKYDDRAREIVRGRSVKDALTELQRSKISIDGEALRLWCERYLRDDYDRYITLLRSGIVVVDETYKTELMSALAQGEFPETLYDVPINEASALFARLVTRVIWECIYNSEHGLDCYLSLRVRHGTLSGQLRGPVEQEKIVTRRDASSGKYLPNDYWTNVLRGNISGSQLGTILIRLGAFSQSYDDLIAEITDKLIQVRGKEKPEGLFDLRMPELSIYGLATEIDSSTSFQKFLDSCFEVFWALLETRLNTVREYLDVNLRTRIREQFDELENDFLEMPENEISWLTDAIRRARTETSVRLDIIAKLLKEANKAPPLRFNLDRETLTFTVEFELDYAEIASADERNQGASHESAIS